MRRFGKNGTSTILDFLVHTRVRPSVTERSLPIDPFLVLIFVQCLRLLREC